jgi:transglutaminase-like putative cysteine protease
LPLTKAGYVVKVQPMLGLNIFLPGFGWVGLDPTNNILVNSHHIKLATGRDFSDCTPVKGIFKGIAKQSLSVYVSVGYEDGHVFEDRNSVKMRITTG